MLAQLLHVPVSTVRRWHRRGLIVPVREVYRLPYFDFQEVATARRLAQLLAAGASPAAIEKKLAQLARMVPDVERPIAQLSVIVEGRQLLLRKGEGLIQSDGQRRIDFDAAQSAQPDEPASALTPTEPDLLRIDLSTPRSARGQPLCPAEDLAARAAQCEDEGVYPHAIELYRAALIAGGPRADWCFRLAELLYLTGDVVAARERYLMAIELDEQFVEARANLGCVLAELGEPLLAIAAFRGALAYHPDYPDAHYHLARTLEELGQHEEAEGHWWAFLELAPESPWADEARAHVDQPQPV